MYPAGQRECHCAVGLPRESAEIPVNMLESSPRMFLGERACGLALVEIAAAHSRSTLARPRTVRLSSSDQPPFQKRRDARAWRHAEWPRMNLVQQARVSSLTRDSTATRWLILLERLFLDYDLIYCANKGFGVSGVRGNSDGKDSLIFYVRLKKIDSFVWICIQNPCYKWKICRELRRASYVCHIVFDMNHIIRRGCSKLVVLGRICLALVKYYSAYTSKIINWDPVTDYYDNCV